MVVKAATKKRLMDLGLGENIAHLWADGKRWEELIQLDLDDTMDHLWEMYQWRYHLERKDNRYARGPPPGVPKPEIDKKTFLIKGPKSWKRWLSDSGNFTKDISEFIEAVKKTYGIIDEKYGIEHSIHMSNWGVKKVSRKMINWNTLPWGGEK